MKYKPPRRNKGYLREGMTIELIDGKRYLVTMVNFSRARIKPLFKVKHEVTKRITGEKIVFESYPGEVNIGPDSEVLVHEYVKPKKEDK